MIILRGKKQVLPEIGGVKTNNVLNRFIRFGKFDSFQIQNVYVVNGKEPSSIHVAPEKRGFYAMPLKYQELFLISSLEDTLKDVFPKNKVSQNTDGWYVWDELMNYNKRINYIKYNLIRHSFMLKDSDLLWHHLHFYNVVTINEIERRAGDWVFTSVGTFKKAIGRVIAKLAKENEMHRGNINVAKLDKDDFEVFIPAGTVK